MYKTIEDDVLKKSAPAELMNRSIQSASRPASMSKADLVLE